MKSGQFMSYYKKKNKYEKTPQNYNLKTISKPFCLQRIKHKLYWEIKLLKQATYITYVLARE